MRILAMDTATSACSVALMDGGAIISHRLTLMSRGQAEALAPMVSEVLESAGTTASALDLLAVSVGPGAFTGLRIGLAMARGMALAANVPCLGLTTTEVIAAGVEESAWPAGSLLVAVDSKRADIYVQQFSAPGQQVSGPQAVEPQQLADWLAPALGPGPIGVVGDAASLAVAALEEAKIEALEIPAPGVPDARVMAALAARGWSKGDALPPPPGPLYLRPPDAKLPRHGGRLRP